MKPPRFWLAIIGSISSPATFATIRTSFEVAMAVLWPVLGRISAHSNRLQAAIFKAVTSIFNRVGVSSLSYRNLGRTHKIN